MTTNCTIATSEYIKNATTLAKEVFLRCICPLMSGVNPQFDNCPGYGQQRVCFKFKCWFGLIINLTTLQGFLTMIVCIILTMIVCIFLAIIVCIFLTMIVCIFLTMIVCIFLTMIVCIFLTMIVCIYLTMIVCIFFTMIVCIFLTMIVCIFLTMIVCIFLTMIVCIFLTMIVCIFLTMIVCISCVCMMSFTFVFLKSGRGLVIFLFLLFTPELLIVTLFFFGVYSVLHVSFIF